MCRDYIGIIKIMEKKMETTTKQVPDKNLHFEFARTAGTET